MRVVIYFSKDNSLILNSGMINENDLNKIVNWFKQEESEVISVEYKANDTFGEFLLNRRNIEYIKTEHKY